MKYNDGCNDGFNDGCYDGKDTSSSPYVINIERKAIKNEEFREVVWTGEHLQLTVMCIPVCGDIGVEIHPGTDQYIRIEQGSAVVRMGKCRNKIDKQCNLFKSDAIFIPAGTWHNVINSGRIPLKLTSVYAPPQHPKNAKQHTKEN